MIPVLIAMTVLAILTTWIAIPGLREKMPGGTQTLNAAVVVVLTYIWSDPAGPIQDRMTASIPLAAILAWCTVDYLRRDRSY